MGVGAEVVVVVEVVVGEVVVGVAGGLVDEITAGLVVEVVLGSLAGADDVVDVEPPWGSDLAPSSDGVRLSAGTAVAPVEGSAASAAIVISMVVGVDGSVSRRSSSG